MISKRFGVKPEFTIYWPFLSGLSRSSISLIFKKKKKKKKKKKVTVNQKRVQRKNHQEKTLERNLYTINTSEIIYKSEIFFVLF
jgi:hypothetical protein